MLTANKRGYGDIVGFPKRYQDLSWNSVIQFPGNVDALKACQDWMDGRVENLFIYGAQGTGKTHLACAAMLASQRQRLTFNSVPVVMLKFQEGVKEHDELQLIRSFIETRKQRTETQAILFDDVAAHRISDFGIEMFCIMLEKLYSDMADGFIFTSNLSPKQIMETMGERVSSRLCGLARPVKIEGKDLRLA